MAERFPRYEQQLTGLKIPNVEFAAEREIAAGYNQISKSLDRMSSFFMGQAEVQAKLEGAEYGASQAPSQQQIEDAYNDGEPIELAGDSYSVYGRAARAAALNAATDDIEFLAKKEILEFMVEAERNEYDQATVNEKIDTISAGYSAVMDAESPGNAKKLRAGLGLFGYGKSQAHATKMLKITREREIASFAAAYNLSLEGISDVIKNSTTQEIMIDEAVAAQSGETPGTTITVGAAETADAILDKNLNSILKRAVSLRMSKAQIDGIVKTWNDEIFRSQKIIVLGEVIGHEAPGALLENMTSAVREMNHGGSTSAREQLPSGVRNALQLAKNDKRLELLDLARQSYRQTIEDSNSQITVDENARKISIRNVNSNYARGLRNQDLALMGQAANEMMGLDGVRSQQMIELNQKLMTDGFVTQNIDDVATRQKYETDLINPNPVYDLADLTKDRLSGNLSHNTFITLAEKYENQYDADFKTALDEVKAIIGIPQNAYADSSFLDSVANQIYTSIETQLMKEKRMDTTGEFSAQAWVDENLNDFYTKTTQDITSPIKIKAKKYSRRTAETILAKAVQENDQALQDEMNDLIKDVDDLLRRDADLILPGWMDN